MSTEHASGAASGTLAATALEPLLAGLVDYAGTFPPAGLEVHEACEVFARAHRGRTAWICGRFAVALKDLAGVDGWLAARVDPDAPSPIGIDFDLRVPWPVTAVVGTAVGEVAGVLRGLSHRVAVEALECRAATPADVAAAAEALVPLVARATDAIVEVPADDESAWPELLDAIAEHGLRAKLRTGSIRPAEIPSTATVARFLAACARRDLALKLTAGLHRALRATRALTYEQDGPCAPMHGFVNAYAAAGLAFVHGADADALERCLEATDADAFGATDEGLVLRAHGEEALLTTDQLRDLRARRVAAFGSCSFDEPIDDLVGLGWLAPDANAAR